MEFRESDCYKQSLSICASGSAILTELLRLSNYIPDIFMIQQTSNKKGAEKYALNGKALDDQGLLRYTE